MLRWRCDNPFLFFTIKQKPIKMEETQQIVTAPAKRAYRKRSDEEKALAAAKKGSRKNKTVTKSPSKTTAGKGVYALNIGDDTTKLIIDNAKSRIEYLAARRLEIQGPLAEAKKDVEVAYKSLEEARQFHMEYVTIFNQVKKVDDDTLEEIKKNEALIKAMSGYKEVEGEKKFQKVTTPPLTTKGFDSVKRIDWLGEAENVIRDKGKAIKIGDLMDLIASKREVIEAMTKSRSRKSVLKAGGTTSIINHSQLAGKNRKLGTQILTIYNDKIGLYDWVNDKLEPHPQHLTKFMGQ